MDDETLGALRAILDYIDDDDESGRLTFEEREAARKALRENVTIVRAWMDG